MGSVNVNYYQTNYGYDSDGRLVRTQTANGTIYRTVYNSLGEALSDWVGTNDTPTSGEWSPSNNNGTANMVMVSSYQYDNGGVGDGNLTQQTDYPGLGATPRVSDFWYDWRDREVAAKSGVQSSEADATNRPIVVTTYDNLDEPIETQQYLGDGVTPQIVNGVLQALDPSLLRGQEIDSYDDQGRVYQTQVYDVNPNSGAVSGSALTTNYYFDHRGNLMAESDPGGLWTKSVYDGAGRDVIDYTTDGAGGTTWADAATVANDTVLEQEQTVYDADSNAIETIDSQRFHNATGTGALGTPTSGIGARVYYAAQYYDNADRLVADVDAGTNGGTAWTRPGTVPASSPTLLVTTYAYNSMGLVQDVTDPMGIVNRTYYDDLGRTTKTIQDYTGGTPGPENDVATEYGYDGNDHVIYVQADEPGGGYQKTAYVYGVTTGGGDGVNSNDILSAIQHPDPSSGNPSSSQQDSYLVNALGDVVQYTDRNGSVHQYSHDVLGRITSDAVTTLGAGVDGTIRRIDYAYDSQGNLALITSYNAASGGNIINQVQRVFNGLGQLTGEYQSHNGPVSPSSTPEVQYAYSEMSGGQNNSRLVSMTYPNGYVLNFNYNTGLDSNISRLSSISDSTGTLESYLYLGLSTVVERARPQAEVNLTYIAPTGDPKDNYDGGDQYTGLDRFGRVIDQNWAFGSGSLDRIQYGYNQDGDVVYADNLVNTAMSEVYTYDNLNELTSFAQGTLNATKTGISGTPSRSQSFTPDALGNFSSVTTDGATQTRTANQQNEYTSISGVGTITYDANGNLTADETGNTYVYDAWDRLVAVKNGGTTVASYGYDGLDRLIQVTESGTTTDLYVSSADQVLAEYQGSVSTAYNVWSPVYVNALVFRAVGSGYASQRYYALQDANWNVTAWMTTAPTVVERYAYDPFGAVEVLDANWNVLSSSSLNMPYGFQGMRYDWTVRINPAWERDYDPAMMDWMQTDPLGQVTGNNGYTMEGNGPTDAVDPSGLYEEDVHFYLTYYLALAVGLGNYQSNHYWGFTSQGAKNYMSVAYIIAWADAYVDVHSETEPVRGKQVLKAALLGGLLFGIPGAIYWGDSRNSAEAGIRWVYHFRTEPGNDKVIANSPNTYKWVDRGIKQGSPMLTGIAMHAYQDSWAHQGCGPYSGHLTSGHAPDWPWKNKEEAMKMAKATYDKLADYMWTNYHRLPEKKWEEIKDTIEQLLGEFDHNNPENTSYRSNLWYKRIRQDFPAFYGRFVSDGDKDGWAIHFLQMARLMRRSWN